MQGLGPRWGPGGAQVCGRRASSRAPGGAAPGGGPGLGPPLLPPAAPEAGDGAERAVSGGPGARGRGRGRPQAGLGAPGRGLGTRGPGGTRGVWAPVGAGRARGGGRCGARVARASPGVEPGLRRRRAGGRCGRSAPASGLGPRGLRAPPAPAAPQGPGAWPLQCTRPVTRGKRRARWPLAGPAPTRTGRGSVVGRPARPAPDALLVLLLVSRQLPRATGSRGDPSKRQLALSSALVCLRASRPVSGPPAPATLRMPHPGPRPLARSYSPEL